MKAMEAIRNHMEQPFELLTKVCQNGKCEFGPDRNKNAHLDGTTVVLRTTLNEETDKPEKSNDKLE
ncbi:hypothetical protein RvY_18406 [Ramazzottius varieornatus]|uniref:Uncharacterized protein n=1 Tax=Ramazzottius varieornatus TaxID=947166 RepID=A0A1D1WB74_RAMVA|nr:hypothetical protein RvY_18406 [Ramazzottius varieornatus]